MKLNRFASWRLVLTLAVFVLVGGAFLIGRNVGRHPEDQKPGKFPEQLVYVRSKDEVVNAGTLFAPPKDIAKPIAVIWIHGWGANFYTPSYVGIARALANQGYATILGNTRMHDIEQRGEI
jgi:dienelactone hydrolase